VQIKSSAALNYRQKATTQQLRSEAALDITLQTFNDHVQRLQCWQSRDRSAPLEANVLECQHGSYSESHQVSCNDQHCIPPKLILVTKVIPHEIVNSLQVAIKSCDLILPVAELVHSKRVQNPSRWRTPATHFPGSEQPLQVDLTEQPQEKSVQPTADLLVDTNAAAAAEYWEQTETRSNNMAYMHCVNPDVK